MSQPAFVLRPATEADLDAILALERTLDTAPHWTRADYARFLTVNPASHSLQLLLVATRAGQLAGFAAASALHAGPQIEAELETVGVAPAHQHQGAGRLLGTAILAWARELGASSITLEVRAASHGPQRLYRSLGFHPAGRRRDYYRSPPDDALLMRLSLAAEV